MFGKKIAKPVDERLFRANHYDVNVFAHTKMNDGVAVAPVEVNAGPELRKARIAWSDVEVRKQGTLGNAPRKSGFPSARAKNEYVHAAKVGGAAAIPKALLLREYGRPGNGPNPPNFAQLSV